MGPPPARAPLAYSWLWIVVFTKTMYRPRLVWFGCCAPAAQAGELEDGLVAHHAQEPQASLHLAALGGGGGRRRNPPWVRCIGAAVASQRVRPRRVALVEASGEANHLPALNVLGEMHEAGEGVAQDFEAAAQWFQKAADAGDAKGQPTWLCITSALAGALPHPLPCGSSARRSSLILRRNTFMPGRCSMAKGPNRTWKRPRPGSPRPARRPRAGATFPAPAATSRYTGS